MNIVEAGFTAQRLIRHVTLEVINVIWVNPGKVGGLVWRDDMAHTSHTNTLGERLRSVTVCMVR